MFFPFKMNKYTHTRAKKLQSPCTILTETWRASRHRTKLLRTDKWKHVLLWPPRTCHAVPYQATLCHATLCQVSRLSPLPSWTSAYANAVLIFLTPPSVRPFVGRDSSGAASPNPSAHTHLIKRSHSTIDDGATAVKLRRCRRRGTERWQGGGKINQRRGGRRTRRHRGCLYNPCSPTGPDCIDLPRTTAEVWLLLLKRWWVLKYHSVISAISCGRNGEMAQMNGCNKS